MNGRALCHVLIILAVSACTSAKAEPLPVDFSMAASLGAVDAGASFLWVLQPGDYVTCETHARAIRNVQRSNTQRVPLTIVAVGGEEQWLKEFLQRERLSGDIHSFTPQAFRHAFGQAPASALYVLRDTRVASAFPAHDQSDSIPEKISRIVREILDESGAASSAG